MNKLDDIARSSVTLGREVTYRALCMSAVGMPLLSVLALINAYKQQYVNSAVVGVCVGTLLFPLLWVLRQRLPFNVVAVSFHALLGAATAALLLRGGLSTSTGAIPVLMIVLAGLAFGRVGSLLCLLTMLLVQGVAGALVVTGITLVEPAAWDPLQPQTWVRASVALLVFGGGIAAAVIYVFESMARETHTLHLALQREAAERSAREQAEAEREHARRALAESHRLESLGRLAGGVAHDFNNILTVIMGNAELALNEARANPKLAILLDEIQRAAMHSAELTQELLMLSRKDLANPQVLNLSDFLQKLRATIHRVIPSDIELVFDTVEKHALVRVVPVNLERALLNLLANARDAIAGHGRIDIVVGIRHPEEPSQPTMVSLSVKDSGSGLDAETQQRMFEPFFTTKHAGSGTGLGLTLVQSFVLDAEGSIAVHSKPGEGTTITLLFPRVVDTVLRPKPEVLSGDSPVVDVGRGRTILAVDDQLPVLATITACLELAGFRVIAASDGDAAMKLVEDTAVSFDLLCIDGVIPGASSAAIIARLRQVRPGIEVVLCSGYVDEELLLRGIQVGELTCVRKPFRPTDLVAAILKRLDARR
jgi:signal transduction histidine kinase/ActR/RegA family two-component response regulator